MDSAPATRDPLADAERLRNLGATSIEVEITRAGTVKIKAQWPDANATPKRRMSAE